MGNIYYFTNSYFDLEVKNGGFTSIKSTKDREDTQFVLPGQNFSKMKIRYRIINDSSSNVEGRSPVDKEVKVNNVIEDDIITWIPSDEEGFTDSEPVTRGRKLEYLGHVNNGHLKVFIKMVLEGNQLIQDFEVRNQTDQEIILEDIGFMLPCNTDFKWGDAAASKVIGHHFIAGHGSHMYYTRCDGNGPYLMMLPYKDTKIEYFNVGEKKEVSKEIPEIFEIYTASNYSYGKAKDLGTCFKLEPSKVHLAPKDSHHISYLYTWAWDYEEAKAKLVEHDLIHIEVVPGLTVTKQRPVYLCVQTKREEVRLVGEHSEDTEIKFISQQGDKSIYQLIFNKLGENRLYIKYGDGCFMNVDFFVTEAIETMIKKRAAFITDKQFKDSKLWYNGLFAEWNNETGVMLGPDNYDRIKGWRIYEVTCDDPGLSKPAFLSSKLAKYPEQKEVEALDYYIENFVWGGLQRTDEEEYPYGIYGIPDWKQNRCSDDKGLGGRLHIWRIYDYPHIALMYYNLYRVAKDYAHIKTKLSALEYLNRSYETALALFLIPNELTAWSAYKTGLYNELIIEDIISALYEEGQDIKADRLERHWQRKIEFFVVECKDVFGSEYPFDTTGFETTHVLAKAALKLSNRSKKEDRFRTPMTYQGAVKFMEQQVSCNIACRGYLEPAYYWYGSDYRGRNYSYTLSYMSQMGGHSLLDYALYYAEDPFPLLRLAYGSILSSWALLNSGDQDSNYGYWFPGKEHDGAACGGFEPLPYGTTWLEQPHRRGAWYYSCEIDLGFCGAIRAAATILAKDPIFDYVLYGGTYKDDGEYFYVSSEDGVGRRFHYLDDNKKVHMELNKGKFSKSHDLVVKRDLTEINLYVDCMGCNPEEIYLNLSTENINSYNVETSIQGNIKIFKLSQI